MYLRTRRKNTLDPAVQQHLEWLSFNWKMYFSSSSYLTWTESPPWWSASSWDRQRQEWHSQGWQHKEWWDQRSHSQTSTRRLVRGRQSENVSVVVKFTVIRTPFVVLYTSQIFSSFRQFRVQTVATAMNATGGVQTTPHRTHTRALFLAAHARTPDVITRLAQVLDDLFVCLKSHFITGHVFVERSLDPVSTYFLITYCLTDTTYCLTDATDWNQIKPLCNSALEWTVWPSGRSDPKHKTTIVTVSRCDIPFRQCNGIHPFTDLLAHPTDSRLQKPSRCSTVSPNTALPSAVLEAPASLSPYTTTTVRARTHSAI